MADVGIPEFCREASVWKSGSPELFERFEESTQFQRQLDVADGRMSPGLPAGQVPMALRHNILWRCETRKNLTGTTLSQIRRGLARAWRLTLSLQTNHALNVIDQIELQLDDLSSVDARRLRGAIQLVRAVALAFEDDILAALAIATSYLNDSAGTRGNYVASTLCRLGFWQLGKLDALYSLPRHQPRAQWSKSHAISAVFDLSIEAAAALDLLQMSTAKRLASDALAIADAAKVADGLASLPACLSAQMLYEEGYLEEADHVLRDRLGAINAEGSIECALRGYLVLVRIARQKKKYEFAAMLLREATVLGERRGWARLIAACLAERVSLLLETRRTREARLSAEYLDRFAETHFAGSARACPDINRYRTVSHWRVSWAEAPTREAVAAFRQLYNAAVEGGDLYTGCRLAVELAAMLASIGETEDADALFLHAVKAGAAAGLCQAFLEGGTELGSLLRRAYDRGEEPGSTEKDVLPFIGSLLSRWDAQPVPRRSGRPRSMCDTLTGRERDILAKIGQGFPNKRIARAFEISPETVKSHIKRIFLKLAVSTRAEAVSRAKSLGAI